MELPLVPLPSKSGGIHLTLFLEEKIVSNTIKEDIIKSDFKPTADDNTKIDESEKN